MEISQEFKQAVSAQNTLRVRILLKNYMLTDPTFQTFDHYLAYAQQQMVELIQPHDGETLNYDVSAWTKDYLDRQMTVVVDNFSAERIELLRNMVRQLYAPQVEASHREQFVTEHRTQHSGPSRKQLGGGLATVGAVAVVAGLVVEEPILPLIAVGAAAAAVGAALILSDRNR